jgi:MFS family permease
MLYLIKWLYNEFGIASVHNTGRDAWLIIMARCCRMFAYGTNALILALFFAELGFSDSHIGLFMTLTLVGDVVLGLFLTLIADKFGRRKTIFFGSILMVLSGASFAIFENYWLLLFAAVVGVISANGGDFGPFRAIEESALSTLTTPKTRPDVLAWYVTTSSIGSCIGTEISGRLVERLRSRDGWHLKDAYHACFWVYSAMGVVNIVICLLLTKNCEAEKTPETLAEESEILLEDQEDKETKPNSISTGKPLPPLPGKKASGWSNKFSQISKDSRSVMYKLWFLLTIDSLADGMTPMTLTNYYIDLKFKMSKATLGDITSVSYFLSALSTIFAGPLARHIGLVNTMVFTHVPSSAAVLFFPLPQNVALTVTLLLIRVGLNNMDQAPRSAFIAAAVKPEERTAVLGLTTILRTLASTVGPTVTGILAGNDQFWIAFVAAGILRLAYDFGLWAMFINYRLNTHEEPSKTKPDRSKKVSDPRASTDEEELDEL